MKPNPRNNVSTWIHIFVTAAGPVFNALPYLSVFQLRQNYFFIIFSWAKELSNFKPRRAGVQFCLLWDKQNETLGLKLGNNVILSGFVSTLKVLEF